MNQMVTDTLNDNTLFAEGAPSNLDWYYGGRLWNGNTPPEGRTHINPWGVIFRTDGSPPPADAALEVGDLALHVKYSGVWQRVVYGPRVQGQMYVATFEGWEGQTTPTTPATVSTMPNAFVVADNAIEDWCYHFFLPKVAIAGTIEGIVVSFKARVVSKTGQNASSYAGTMLAWVGCDYKNSDSSGVQDSFASSMMPLTTSFKRYYGTTLSVSQLRANPPPLGLEQLL